MDRALYPYSCRAGIRKGVNFVDDRKKMFGIQTLFECFLDCFLPKKKRDDEEKR
jgi:hypothetical protein